MGHIHQIIDSGRRFSIDPLTRCINFDAGKLKLIQGDHNSERFTFDIPRRVDGHDMSLCSKVEVHFINISSDLKDKSAGVFLVDDVSATDDVVLFSWLISRNATEYNGILSFLIKFTCVTGTTVDYAWHTELYSDITVGEGMDNGEAIVEKYYDFLEAWKKEAIREITDSIPVDYTALCEKVDKNDKRLSNLEARLDDSVFITDSGVAAEMAVPAGVAPYAEITKIGGMSDRSLNIYPGPSSIPITGAAYFELLPEGKYGTVTVSFKVKGTPLALSLYCTRTTGADDETTILEGAFSYTVDNVERIEIIGSSTDVEICDIQIERGTTATEYKPYFEGFRHAKVTALKSRGVNLWKPDVTEIIECVYGTNDERRDLRENVWYQGLTANNWWLSGHITDINISNNKISFRTEASGYGMVRAFRCKPNTAYTFSFDYEGDFPSGCCIGFYDASGHWLDYDWDAKGIVTPNNCYWLTVNLASNDAPSNCTFSNIMLAESDVEIPYTPYVGTLDTFMVPEVVTSRAWCGLGLEGPPNTIEYVDGRVKLVERVKEGTVTQVAYVGWANEGYSNVDFYAFKMPDDYIGYATEAFRLEGFKNNITSVNWDSPAFFGAATGRATEFEIWVGFPKGTTQAEAEAALIGKSFIYAIATTETTDITNLMPRDNFLKVQSGGSVVQENEHGLAVLVELTYQKEA